MKIQQRVADPMFKVTVGAAAISFSGVWVKIADVTPASSAFYRVFFGFLFLFALSLKTKEKWKIGLPNLLMGLLCGLLFVFDLLCWHGSILLIGPGLATLLGNFQVFILAGLGIILFRERYTLKLLVSIPLAVAGLYFVIGYNLPTMTDSYTYGIYLGLATALFYAAYLLSLRHLSARSTSNFMPMMLVSLTSSAILAVYILFSDSTFSIPSIKSGLSLAALGFFSQFFGWFLIATSLPKLQTSSAGLLLLLQPSLSFVWDVLIFDRQTNMLSWFGVTLTLFAIYLGITSKHGKI